MSAILLLTAGLWVGFSLLIYQQYLQFIFSNIGHTSNHNIQGDFIENNTLLAILILLASVYVWLCLNNFYKTVLLQNIARVKGIKLQTSSYPRIIVKTFIFSIIQTPLALILLLFGMIAIIFEPLFFPILFLVIMLFPIIYSWSNLCFYHYLNNDGTVSNSLVNATKTYKKQPLLHTLNSLLVWNLVHGLLVVCTYYALELWTTLEKLNNPTLYFTVYLYISTFIFLRLKNFFWNNQILVYLEGFASFTNNLNHTKQPSNSE